MNTHQPNRINWADAPCVFIQRPACHACNSLQYTTTRTEQNGDGSITRKAICRECGEPFKIVVEELPNFGNE